MKTNEKVKKEPLFHVVKRGIVPKPFSVLVRVASIFAALLLTSLVVYILGGVNPIRFFGSMFKGAFGTKNLFWKYMYDTSLLLIIAVALTPAFKMRFWNIGGEGQVLIGGLAAVTCMYYLGGKVPLGILYILMVLASVVAASVWALIPAIFKANWNTNETLFTLMMNYVAIQLVAFCIDRWVTSGSGTLPPMHEYGFPTLGNQWLLNILIVVFLTVVVYIYLSYSKHGYELTVVGESENTARYIGINVKKVIIRTMILSGALCGVAGLIIAGGMNHTISVGTVQGRGFTAILVSWLAKFNPLYMFLTSLLVAFFDVGALQVNTDFGLNKITDITTAIVLFCIVGCEFFINYRIVFRGQDPNRKIKEVGKS